MSMLENGLEFIWVLKHRGSVQIMSDDIQTFSLSLTSSNLSLKQ